VETYITWSSRRVSESAIQIALMGPKMISFGTLMTVYALLEMYAMEKMLLVHNLFF
jgi:hypothetical protein